MQIRVAGSGLTASADTPTPAYGHPFPKEGELSFDCGFVACVAPHCGFALCGVTCASRVLSLRDGLRKFLY